MPAYAVGMKRDTDKPPPKITAAYLAWITAWYLERWATSTSHLRRLLLLRVRRSAAHHGGEAQGQALVEAELRRLVAAGLLDDVRFAADKARSLRRRGASAAKIRASLAAKGLVGEPVSRALAGDGVDVDARDATTAARQEWRAALVWARRHRVGPWRRGAAPDRDGRRTELARFGRAGFAYAIAARIVDAVDEDGLDDPDATAG